VNSSFWVMLSFVSWERFSDFDSDHVLILTYLLMGERPYIPMDLVDLVVDVLAELGVDRVNKEIVDSDYKPIEGLRYIRIQRVIHPKNIHVEEGCIVDHFHFHYHYHCCFAFVVIDVLAALGSGPVYPPAYPNDVLLTDNNLGDSFESEA
jgi:hypothetical protein